MSHKFINVSPVQGKHLLLILSAIVLTSCAEPSSVGYKLEKLGQLSYAPIAESSGLSRQAGSSIVWTHNDSGDDARLFAVTETGQLIIPINSRASYHGENSEAGKKAWPGLSVAAARNIDWEDITADEHNLYIGDIGNNRNRRRDMGIYVVDSEAAMSSSEITPLNHWPISYPDQTFTSEDKAHFDSESLFFVDGKLYFITKHRVSALGANWEPGAKLYRLDTTYADQDNPLTLIDSHGQLRAATGAEVSPDGDILAVISYGEAWLFNRPETGDAWLSSSGMRLQLAGDISQQIEAVAWLDDETLIFSNEQRDLFHLPISQFSESEYASSFRAQ